MDAWDGLALGTWEGIGVGRRVGTGVGGGVGLGDGMLVGSSVGAAVLEMPKAALQPSKVPSVHATRSVYSSTPMNEPYSS